MEKKRSKGITIIAIIQIVAWLLTTLILIYSYIQFKFEEPALINNPNPHEVTITHINLFFLKLAAILNFSMFIFGIGLLKLKKWARLFSIIIAPLLIFGNCVLFLFSTLNRYMGIEFPTNSLSSVTSIVLLYLIYIYFFTRPKVKAQFSPERTK